MSIDKAEISRDNILRLVRKSASTDCNSESFREAAAYPEHRIKFLERRKQFEEPSSPVKNKPPFLPHWINPEYDTDLSITYKKKGAEITDLRINHAINNDGSNKEIGIKNASNVPVIGEKPKAIENLNKDSVVDGRFNGVHRLHARDVNVNFHENGNEPNSSATTTADKNRLGISYKSVKLPMDRRSKPIATKPIRSTQSLRSNEERSASTSTKTVATLDCSRPFDAFRKNQSMITTYSIPHKLIVCRPIVRRPIELKRYNHIVTNVIGTER